MKNFKDYIYVKDKALDEELLKRLVAIIEKNVALWEEGNLNEYKSIDFNYYFFDTDQIESLQKVLEENKDIYLKKFFAKSPNCKISNIFLKRFDNKKASSINLNIDSWRKGEASNILTMILFLNKIRKGGEIAFCKPINAKFAAEENRLFVFPSSLMYPYFHLPLKKDIKYIVHAQIAICDE